MKTKLVLLFFVSLLTVLTIKAQNEAMAIEFTPYGTNAMVNQSGKFQFAIPVLKWGNQRLFFAPEYKFISGKLIDIVPANYYDQLSLRMAWQYKINETWKLQYVMMPAITSVLTHESSFLFNTIFRATYKYENITVNTGVAYSYRYKNNILTPVVGIMWNTNKKLTINAGLPFNLKLNYMPTYRWYTGFEISGNSISALSGKYGYDFVWLHEKTMFLYSDIKLYRNLWLSLAAGYTFKRTLKTYQLPDQSIWTVKIKIGEPGSEPVTAYEENGLSFRAGIKFKIN